MQKAERPEPLLGEAAEGFLWCRGMQLNSMVCNTFDLRVREIWWGIRKALEWAIVVIHTVLGAAWNHEISADTRLILCKVPICSLVTAGQEITLAFSCALATVYEKLPTIFNCVLIAIYPE